MNTHIDVYNKGPAIASAEAMFKSDRASMRALTEHIGWVRMCASSAQFSYDVLGDLGFQGNAHALGHFFRAASAQIKRKLALECLDGDFDSEIAYQYGIKFLETAIIEPMHGKSTDSYQAAIILDRKNDEAALVAACAAVNQFVIMFDVDQEYKSGNIDVSSDSLIERYRIELAGHCLGAEHS